ncbi:hypothetical protein SDRG_05235 [Saprolegnia diclina VS20]|uniref:Uncharacterized protein n=1 Tax=Saprolegnia diclina (strain VS20) TaxID=1156394 RepID=T0RYI8_SAPDV|nr:hypothetical protein SDRG_05235 [Saprolegnia diclina VS20]EQC37643.1 hypothetical protein SDRG_05235 [Saprolegnia diclina VS20]|eukprot:XP_008609163.1 hypothetical protein SDRG_05235 [Saprolegnia diclina VS20]
MSAPKSLLDVANQGGSAKRSLLDVANAAPAISAAPTLQNVVAKPTLMGVALADKPSLLTVAKEAPMTLADVAAAPSVSLQAAVAATIATDSAALTTVAKTLRQDSRSSFQKAPTQSLVQIANEVEQERDAAVVHALADASKAVKQDQARQQSNVGAVLVEAARAVAAEDAAVTKAQVAATLKKAAAVVQKACTAPTPAVATPTTTTKSTNNNNDNNNNKDDEDDDEYSDFDDDDTNAKKKKKPAKKAAQPANDDDNQSDAADEVEKTSPTVSSESKVFLQAVFRGNLRRVQDLLGDDTDVNITDQHGWNGLHWAASQGHTEILELLIERGANVQAVEPEHLWSPLHLAAIRGHGSCIKHLLRAGAVVARVDVYGDTPVACIASFSAPKKKHLESVFRKHQRA